MALQEGALYRMALLSYQAMYTMYDALHRPPEPERALTAMEQFNKRRKVSGSVSAFDRINQCRRALDALDRQGWNRSYHQRQFHEQFIRACARIFYKTEPPGTFQRDHQKLLQLNEWANLSQEILISTPRRCKKNKSLIIDCSQLTLFLQLERPSPSACSPQPSSTARRGWNSASTARASASARNCCGT